MKKQKKEVKFRHKVLVSIFRVIIGFFIKRKYNYKPQINKLKKEGPFLIIANHTVPVDPIILGTHFDFPIYYVATDLLFNMGLLSKLLVYAVNPIPKSKSTSDITTIKKIKRVIDQNGSVCIFPEGNLSYDGASSNLNISICRLIKFLNVKVIFFNMHGLYFQNPRWSVNRKQGKAICQIKKILDPDEYQNLNDDQLYNIVLENTYVNAYDDEFIKNNTYKGNDLALGLERFMFACPNCNSLLTLKSYDNSISCSKCDAIYNYDEYGYLSSKENKYSLVEINQIQLPLIYNWFREFNNDLYFKNQGEITCLITKKYLGNATIAVYSDKLEIFGLNYHEIYDYIDISAIAIQGKNKLIINAKESRLLFKFLNLESPYIYYLAFIFYKHYYKNNQLIDLAEFKL